MWETLKHNNYNCLILNVNFYLQSNIKIHLIAFILVRFGKYEINAKPIILLD